MMNLSELLTSIKMDLGIYGLSLPFENENKILHDVLKLRTITTFSQFQPHIVKIPLKLNDMNCISSNYQESIYQIPDVFGDRRIMYIRRVEPRNKLLGSGYISPIFDGSIDIYNTIMSAQANADLLSAITPPFTFKFVGPNMLHLFNMTSMATELYVEFALEHADNFSTIPNTTWESFYELALLDIKRFLYGAMKHYTEIQTAYGNINLKIDDWANAEQERKDLLERWRDVYHLDVDQFIVV